MRMSSKKILKVAGFDSSRDIYCNLRLFSHPTQQINISSYTTYIIHTDCYFIIEIIKMVKSQRFLIGCPSFENCMPTFLKHDS